MDRSDEEEDISIILISISINQSSPYDPLKGKGLLSFLIGLALE
jgi:hypothetical protein